MTKEITKEGNVLLIASIIGTAALIASSGMAFAKEDGQLHVGAGAGIQVTSALHGDMNDDQNGDTDVKANTGLGIHINAISVHNNEDASENHDMNDSDSEKGTGG